MSIIDNHIDKITKLCKLHNVDTLHVFGSVLNSDFTDNRDIDFLVRFQQIDLAEYFENYINLKEGLQQLLGHAVDLLEEQTLRNPILIDSVNQSKALIYG
ncbi:MAG: nucleotidyltransferase domain-containing protein [Bacteroidota bacterium]